MLGGAPQCVAETPEFRQFRRDKSMTEIVRHSTPRFLSHHTSSAAK
jgi:hypothetical protein